MFIRHPFNPKLTNGLTLLSIFVFSLMAIVYLQQPRLKELTESKINKIDYKKEAEIEKAKLDILKKSPSFGFDNLLANWTMLRFVQYYGDGEARKETDYSLSPEYLKVISKYDPNFASAYLIISPASSINAGRPDQTVAIMSEGLEKLSPKVPDAYFVWLYKGVDELLFLGDIKAAKKSYQMAANWAKIGNNPKIEKAAQDTVNFLEKNPDSKVPQVGAWFMVWANSTDKNTRALAQHNIEKLGGRIEIHPNGVATAIPPKQG